MGPLDGSKFSYQRLLHFLKRHEVERKILFGNLKGQIDKVLCNHIDTILKPYNSQKT